MKYFLSLLFLLGISLSCAQLSYRGEVEVAGDLTFVSSNRTLTDTVGLTLRGHLEADYSVEPLDFRFVLDPAVRFRSAGLDGAFTKPGLTEVFALYRLDTVDLSAGLERLPLETARLSVPFRVEPVGKTGQPLGLLGVRATLFLEDWRVRSVLAYRTQDDQLGGVLSVRREFESFDLEAHVVYLDGFTVGLGGSGLVGDVVVYGEAWLLTNPWNGRGALGASGFQGDLLWTVEAAYAPTVFRPGDAYPQLLGQFSLPQGDTGNWDLNVGFGSVDSVPGDESSLQALGSLFYTYFESDYQVTLGPTFSHTDSVTVYGLRFGVTSFF